MLLEIGAAADDETVEHADAPPVRDQAVDEMAADETRAAGDEVDTCCSQQAAPR